MLKLRPAALTLALLSLSVPAMAQTLTVSSGMPPQSALTHPAGLSHSWFGPVAAGGQTYRQNRVTLNAAVPYSDVLGGYSPTLNVADNRVLLLSGAKAHSAVGGVSQSGVYAVGNEVCLEAGSSVTEALGALSTGTGTLRDNAVILKGRARNVMGALSSQGAALSNEVTVESTGQADTVTGARARGDASSNEVIIESGATAGTVYGAISHQGRANSNFVSLSGSVRRAVGAYGATEAASNFLDIMEGGKADEAFGAVSVQAVRYNSVTLWEGAAVTALTGAQAQSTAESNYVTVSKGAEAGTLVGAQSAGGDTLYNTVRIYGKAGTVTGAKALTGGAYFNEVFLEEGAEISGDVTGGSGVSDASYNLIDSHVTVRGNLTGGYAPGGNADFNLVLQRGELTGNAVAGSGLSANHNTLILRNASVSGDVMAALASQGEHNLTVLEGYNSVKGTVYAARSPEGLPLNLHNEISVNGTATVGGLDGFHRLHLLAENKNQGEAGEHILTVTGAEGLDLRGRELWVSGLSVQEGQRVDLIYVESEDKLYVDEGTLIRGDNSFVFNAWVPRDEHVFEHELIWEESASEDTEPPVSPGTPPAGNLNDGELFEPLRIVDQSYAQSLISVRTAALFTVHQGNTLSEEVPAVPGTGIAPFARVSYFDSSYDLHGTLKLHGYALLAGISLPLGERTALTLFAEGGESHSSHGLGEVKPRGSFNYTGAGLKLAYNCENLALEGMVRAGSLSADFEAFYPRSGERVTYSHDSPYYALSISPSLCVPLSPALSFDSKLSYALSVLESDHVTLEHRDRNRLQLDRAYLHSLCLSTGLTFSPVKQLTLCPALYALAYLNDGVEARIEGFDIDRHDTGVHSVGLSLDAHGSWQSLNFNVSLRQGYGTLEESAVSALISYYF